MNDLTALNQTSLKTHFYEDRVTLVIELDKFCCFFSSGETNNKIVSPSSHVCDAKMTNY